MADEAFHEIQLNGKQLVFLFMAATVVAVVIFLCGVMVGRGIRVDRPGELADMSVEAASDPTARSERSPTSESPTRPGTTATAPSATEEELSYPERLSEPRSVPETLNETATPRRPPRAAAPDAPAPQGDGFTVQVAAVRQRIEAATIANRLAEKGYAAYVMPPAQGAPQVFRVRVGKFKERREAELVAARLEREEQFKPWITR